MRWIVGGTPPTTPTSSLSPSTASDSLGVHDTLLALPTLLDGSSLPNGVLELLIEDVQAPARLLFDIHDDRVTLIEPGECVLWASIAGTTSAWTTALGPGRDTTALRLTGDVPLARHVLTALPLRG